MANQLSNEDKVRLQQLESSALAEGSLKITKPDNLAQLLTAARSEFIRSKGSFDGFYMKGVQSLFGHIAPIVYGSIFIWSEYNERQWLKFVDVKVGYEGGACMFSLEGDGNLPESANAEFKGLGLGTPLGMYPYEFFTVTSTFGPQLSGALGSFDYSPFRNRVVEW
jgi:hypothetical protein